LDIREAEAEELEIRGVPARLIRRDPESQVVITRQKAMEGTWRQLNLEKTHWGYSIDRMLRSGEPDIVLVAGRRDRQYRDLLAGLRTLREAGVAEPD
jgi:hypothetical protein